MSTGYDGGASGGSGDGTTGHCDGGERDGVGGGATGGPRGPLRSKWAVMLFPPPQFPINFQESQKALLKLGPWLVYHDALV